MSTALPGQSVPARRDARTRRHELRGRVQRPTACCCACSMPTAPRPGSRCRSATAGSGTASSRASGPARRTATGPPARTIRRRGAALQPGEAAARPLRQGDRRRGAVRTGGARLRRRRSRRAQRARLGRPRAAQPGRRPRLRAGATPPAAATPYADTVIYEVHVKGFTAAHPDVPPELRGTYAGLAHPAAIGHSSTSVSPRSSCCRCTTACPRRSWSTAGLTNYWGYNTIGFFAPHAGYSAAVRAGRPGGQVAEFQAMVDALHAAGLEVILDVVFNHTAEGGHLGPTLCHRGLDNPAYYRLEPGDPRRYVDTTGCGNSLNAGDPVAPAADHGLAAVLGDRDAASTDSVSTWRRRWPARTAASTGVAAFFDLVVPGPGGLPGQADRRALGRRPGRQLRRRPVPAAVERVERPVPGHDAGLLAQPRRAVGEFATRFTGSSDLYGGAGRRPTASVNLITVHDGFTLADLVSYDDKHNEANGEDNRDGTDDNRSWNCGVEGPTDDPDILALRARQTPGDARHAAAVLRRADAARRRRARPHPARQQQRLLPGQRDQLVRLVRGRRASCSAFTRQLIALRRRIRCSAAGAS